MTAPTFSEIELALTSAALAGDAGGLYHVTSGLMDDGVAFDSVLFDYLIAAESAVGKRWEQGDYLIAEEHAATAAIETVISLMTGMFDQPADAPLIAIATAEGDDHSLPARAVAAHLLYLGYRTTFLGASVPGPDLQEFLETEPPRAVVLSCAMTTHLLGARSAILASHEVGVPVLVGGKAFGPRGEWADAVGADAWVGTLREAAEVVEGWIDEAPRDLNDVPPLPRELVDLQAVRSAIVAEAEAELAGNASEVLPARLTDEVRLLLASVEAALLTGDDRVVTDMLRWQEKTLAAHGLDGSSVASAVQTALDAASTQAGVFLRRARQTVAQ
ncbi:MAG: cobalamin-dependent protein [Acidimicrobiia bacterium]|jgi:methanogenic corrinoid protein MtbC1